MEKYSADSATTSILRIYFDVFFFNFYSFLESTEE